MFSDNLSYVSLFKLKKHKTSSDNTFFIKGVFIAISMNIDILIVEGIACGVKSVEHTFF